MAASPEELLEQFADHDAEEMKMVGVRVPLHLLREVWRYGVTRKSRSEGRCLIAVIKDWLRLRKLEQQLPQEPSPVTEASAEPLVARVLQGDRLSKVFSLPPKTARPVDDEIFILLDFLQRELEAYQSFRFHDVKEQIRALRKGGPPGGTP